MLRPLRLGGKNLSLIIIRNFFLLLAHESRIVQWETWDFGQLVGVFFVGNESTFGSLYLFINFYFKLTLIWWKLWMNEGNSKTFPICLHSNFPHILITKNFNFSSLSLGLFFLNWINQHKHLLIWIRHWSTILNMSKHCSTQQFCFRSSQGQSCGKLHENVSWNFSRRTVSEQFKDE